MGEYVNNKSLFWALNLDRQNHPNSDVFLIDIGANLGYYSLSAASLGYQVIAFEPMKENLRAFQMSINKNKGFANKIKLYDLALGEGEYECDIDTSDVAYLNGMLRCNNDTKEAEIKPRNEKATVTTLDSFIELIPKKAVVGAIKTDTEGMDYYVLKGG